MKLLFLTFLVLPAVLVTLQTESKFFAYAEEDELDDESVDIEGDETQVVGEDVVEEAPTVKKSADIDTTILFTKPVPNIGDSQFELRAGQPVEFLVGFLNKGKEDFVVETLDASFRYPMDYSYYIQNFSAIAYHRDVKPTHEATLSYSFLPSEAFAGRPFGLNINLVYKDASGNVYQEAVYNQTVNIVEVSEGLDGETFFLYIFLGAVVVLILVVGQQALSSLAKKRSPRSQAKTQIETGTNNSNVDYDWLPKEVINQISKSPKPTRQSPRLRKNKRSVGSDD